jgi:hypothetical protein
MVPSSQNSITRCVRQLRPAPAPALPTDADRRLPPAHSSPPAATVPSPPVLLPPNISSDGCSMLLPQEDEEDRSSRPIVKLVNSCTMFGCRRLAFSHDSYSCWASSNTTCAAWLSQTVVTAAAAVGAGASPAAAPPSGCERSSGCWWECCCCCCCCCWIEVPRATGKDSAEGCLTWMTLTATTEPHQTPAVTQHKQRGNGLGHPPSKQARQACVSLEAHHVFADSTVRTQQHSHTATSAHDACGPLTFEDVPKRSPADLLKEINLR